MELGGGRSVVDIHPLCENPSQKARNPISPAAESAYLCEVFTGVCLLQSQPLLRRILVDAQVKQAICGDLSFNFMALLKFCHVFGLLQDSIRVCCEV